MNYWQGEKIKLRSVEPEDGEFFFEALSDLLIQRNASEIRFPKSKKACQDWANEMAVHKNVNEFYFFVIEDREGNRVGMIDTHHVDQRVGCFSYGLFIRPEYRRLGYAKESIIMLVRFFFGELRFQKVTVNMYSYNDDSRLLHERIGFMKEGHIRRVGFARGEHFDELVYGMTKEEFFALFR